MADLSEQYQQKTDKQHILDNPDTYAGLLNQLKIMNLYTKMEVLFRKYFFYTWII